MDSKKILVTGGTGLIGKALQGLEYFEDALFIGSRDCDLTDYNETFALMKMFKPDIVIHLAAAVGGLFANMSGNDIMFEKNLSINTNVVRAAHANNVQTLIGCLSTCIFPDKTTYPINEDMVHKGPPHDSNYGYAYAKRMLDIHCRTYREKYGRNYFCIIPTNIYGFNDNFNLESSHVIPGLIHKCYLAKEHNEDFIVAGSGKPLRQFINSKDIAKLLERILTLEINENIIVSVDPEEEVSIDEVARIIAKSFKYEHRMKYDPSLADGQYRKTADNVLLRKFVPDFEFTNIEKGIGETVSWFKDNYKKCRK